MGTLLDEFRGYLLAAEVCWGQATSEEMHRI